MDLVEWVEEAESLLRRDGLWPEQDEERPRGVLEEPALEGPESLVRAMRTLPRELRERDAVERRFEIPARQRVSLQPSEWAHGGDRSRSNRRGGACYAGGNGLSIPRSIRPRKWLVTLAAKAASRMRRPISMFRSRAASVKFADVMNTASSSVTTAFA